MFNSVRTRERWYPGLPAALIGAIIAGVAVAAVALATDPTPSREPSGTPASRPVSAGAPVSRSVPASALALQGAIVNVVRSVSPSVVQIEDQRGLGSGIVFDASGHIVTNNHVVADAVDGGKLTATFPNGKKYDAEVVGHAQGYDVAVIKLKNPPSDLKPLTLGDSDKVAVGDSTIAIGAPFGLSNTVTTGIISAKNRPVASSDGTGSNASYMSALQTDASINPATPTRWRSATPRSRSAPPSVCRTR